MMEERELRELVSLFEQSSLQVMEIEKNEGALRIRMEKGIGTAAEMAAAGAGACQTVPVPAAASAVRAELPETAERAQLEEGGCTAKAACETVAAPLVGTFYEAPAPGEPAFAEVGQSVEEGQTLCLIEAMKMMNELKAPVSGVVKRIGAENGQLVEFGQVLFEIERFEIERPVGADSGPAAGGTSC